jgi:hypothetical protein
MCNSGKRDLTVEELAAGAAGEHWQTWARSYLAGNSRPDHLVVR